MVICLERGANLHLAQLMPLPLTVSCSSKIQIGLPFWYWLTVSTGRMAVKRAFVGKVAFSRPVFYRLKSDTVLLQLNTRTCAAACSMAVNVFNRYPL